MNNILNRKKSIVMLLLLAVCSLSMVSCKDDDSSSGQPEITGVRVCDPEKADSLFTKSSQGQVIAIIGRNLGGIQKIYINDQSVGFSTTMNTDHSVIVTVPSESDGFVLTAFDSSLKDEIRIETDHGTATYAFKVLGAAPVLSRIQGAYPRQAGDVLNIYGLNLYSIESIYFTDVTYEELTTTEWTEVPGNHTVVSDYKVVEQKRYLNNYQNYEVSSQLQITTPDLPFSEGTLVMECAAGTVFIPYSKVPGKPAISSVNTDMPMIGSDLVIKGRDFVQVESVSYGDVTLTASEFTVADTEDTIIVPFTKKPSEGSAAVLTVTTPGGTATMERFYDYSTILTTFNKDDAGNFIDATDNGWGPNCVFEDSGTADGVYAYINVPTEAQQWWGTMIYFRKDWNGNSFPLSSNIPATATADEVYLAVEVYNNNSSYNDGVFSGYIRYMIQPIGDAENQYDNGFEWIDYDAQTFAFADPVLADIDRNAPVGQWYRHVVPLSNFACYAGKTYADIVTTGLNQFRLQSINQGTTSGKIDVKFDNVRVIYIPSK